MIELSNSRTELKLPSGVALSFRPRPRISWAFFWRVWLFQIVLSSGVHRSQYSAETAGDHFALAWVWEVQSKLKVLVPQGDDDPLGRPATCQDLVAIQAQDKALISEYLATQEIGKSRKRKAVELDLNAQIAGMLAGSKVDLHAGIERRGEGTSRYP